MSYKLISAINIHNGGGLTYLYLLHPFLDSKFNTILFDERAKSKLPIFKKAKLIFLKKGLFRNMKVFAKAAVAAAFTIAAAGHLRCLATVGCAGLHGGVHDRNPLPRAWD